MHCLIASIIGLATHAIEQINRFCFGGVVTRVPNILQRAFVYVVQFPSVAVATVLSDVRSRLRRWRVALNCDAHVGRITSLMLVSIASDALEEAIGEIRLNGNARSGPRRSLRDGGLGDGS